jgi:predicted transcriptional regulator
MPKFDKLPTDDKKAPDYYTVRIDMGKENKDNIGRFIYYETLTKLARVMNCSRLEVKKLIQDRRTVSFNEYANFRRK